MTRKDYVVIARAIREASLTTPDRTRLVARIVPVLAEDNHNFKPEAFASACGVTLPKEA